MKLVTHFQNVCWWLFFVNFVLGLVLASIFFDKVVRHFGSIYVVILLMIWVAIAYLLHRFSNILHVVKK